MGKRHLKSCTAAYSLVNCLGVEVEAKPKMVEMQRFGVLGL